MNVLKTAAMTVRHGGMRNRVRRAKHTAGLVLALVGFFGITVYSGTTQTIYSETIPIAVGTIAHSELFDGPATVTVRQLTILHEPPLSSLRECYTRA